MALDLDSAMESTDGSNAAKSTDNSSADDSDEYSELRALVNELGGNEESAIEYAKDSESAHDNIVEYAELVRDDFDAMVGQGETYRKYNCINRIVQNYLRSMDPDFDQWTGQFYGDFDTPEDGTFNAVQQQSRSMDVNLPMHKAIFPEPVEASWDSEPVLWEERPDEDSHIYVSESFVDDYARFARKIGGKERPLPPTNEELAELAAERNGGGASDSSGDVDAPIDPAEFSVRDELKPLLEQMDYSADELRAIFEAEVAGKDRKTAKQKINAEHPADLMGDSDDDVSAAAKAGDLVENEGLDVPPNVVKAALESGKTEDEVVEMFS